ncbi:MAG: hypothetical protein HND57_16630 [Planctomycetes bacterium]|nr:hypothetical protein [Planctomycetota bacterium]
MSSTSGTTDSDRTHSFDDAFSTEVGLANLFLLLSRGFSSPLSMTGTEPAQMQELGDSLEEPFHSAALAAAREWASGLDDRESLALAYARLFLGPFEILAPPYASFYLEPDQRIMGRVSMEVARFYAETGLHPAPGPREAPDHIALELELAYYLTHQFITTGEREYLQSRNDFVGGHMVTWLPAFASAVIRADAHDLYRSLAEMTQCFCDGVTNRSLLSD